MTQYKKGKPLLNRELTDLPDGTVVWVVYERDGRKKWNEPLKIYREEDGSYSLIAPEVTYSGYGEYFISNYSDDPNEQAARDVHDGIFLFHAIKKENKMNGMTKNELLAELTKINDDLPIIVVQVDSFARPHQVEGIEVIDGQIVITTDHC